jgi:hypothetical protein
VPPGALRVREEAGDEGTEGEGLPHHQHAAEGLRADDAGQCPTRRPQVGEQAGVDGLHAGWFAGGVSADCGMWWVPIRLRKTQ